MARVLIVHPPIEVPRAFVDLPPFTVLGAFDLLATLTARGHQVDLLDALLAGEPFARHPAGLRMGCAPQDLVAGMRASGAEWIAIQRTPYHRTQRNVTRVLAPLVQAAASTGARVVLFDGHLGETHYLRDDPERVLAFFPGADAVVLRESGLAVAELIEGRVHANVSVRAGRLAGVAAPGRPGGGSPPTDLPLDRLDVAAYVERFRVLAEEDLILEQHEGTPIFPVSWSRGCPFACAFCTREEGRRWEGRAPEAIEAEARALRARGVELLAVLDPVANRDEARFADLLARVARAGGRVTFPNGLRVDRLGPDTLTRLAAVARDLTVSLESADPRVAREAIGKPLDVAAAEATLARARDLGLHTSVHWILGAPGEDGRAANRTLAAAADWALRLEARPLVQPFVPRARLAVPAGLDALPDDVYASFGEPGPEAAPSPAEVRLRMDVLARKLAERGEAKLIVNLSYACNNRCSFCSVGDRPRCHGDYDTQIAQIRAARARGIRLLDLDGGEPTLYPRLFELLREIEPLGFARTTVTTNGRRLAYRSFVRRLAATEVQVLVSFHGSSPAVHEALTGAPGSFAQTLRGLRHALAEVREVGVNTTVVKGNLDDLPALADLLARLGVRRWTIQTLTPFGTADAAQVPDRVRVREVFRQIVARHGQALGISIIGLPYCELPGLEAYVLDDHYKMARDMLFVDGTRVNLGAYLAERRYHEPDRCDPCAYRLLCNGFWRFPAAPAGTAAAGAGPKRVEPSRDGRVARTRR